MTRNTATYEPQPPVGEIDLLGYVDGLLDGDPARRRAVEAYLTVHSDDAARVQNYITQNQEIRRLYGPVFHEPLPDRLLAALHREADGGRRWRRAAIAAALLLATAAGGWLLGRMQTPGMIRTPSVVVRLPPTNAPARTLPAAQRSPASAMPVEAGLSGADPAAIEPPDLSALGYTLVRKRSVGGPQQRMIALRYTRADGRRLSLYIHRRTPAEDHAIVFSRNGTVATARWLDGPLVYGVVGAVGQSELSAVAAAIQAETAHQRPEAARDEDSGRRGGAILNDSGLTNRTRSAPPESVIAVPKNDIGTVYPIP